MTAPIERVLYAANVTIKLQIIIQTRKKTTAATPTPTTTSSSTTTTIELTLESAFHAIPYSTFHSMPALVGFYYRTACYQRYTQILLYSGNGRHKLGR